MARRQEASKYYQKEYESGYDSAPIETAQRIHNMQLEAINLRKRVNALYNKAKQLGVSAQEQREFRAKNNKMKTIQAQIWWLDTGARDRYDDLGKRNQAFKKWNSSRFNRGSNEVQFPSDPEARGWAQQYKQAFDYTTRPEINKTYRYFQKTLLGMPKSLKNISQDGQNIIDNNWDD